MIDRPILIVDDEAINQEILAELLAKDYALVFASSGHEALDVAAKFNPSLILLDVQMPDKDGLQVCNELKSNSALSHIPVIFVTSLSKEWNEARGFEVGAVDYITKPISPSTLKARISTHLSLVQAKQLEQSYKDAISMLAEAGHYKDTDTGVHIWRMAAYARALATKAGWSYGEADQLEYAATMHDTGKIGIPEKILLKPAKLDADEWQVMRTHSQIGHDILAQSDAPLFKMAAEIALRHHEKWDGSGYPDGLQGTDIPETARIVALADVFDALTMKRPYKEPWSDEDALDFIKSQSGLHFEPRLVDLFISIFPELLEIKDQWNKKEANTK